MAPPGSNRSDPSPFPQSVYHVVQPNKKPLKAVTMDNAGQSVKTLTTAARYYGDRREAPHPYSPLVTYLWHP